MTPEQLATLTGLVALLERIGGLPLYSLAFVIVIGPWVLALVVVYLQGKRFEAAVTMYNNNVHLVQNYEKLANDLHSVVIMNTQVCQRLVDDVEKNQFCPAIRLDKQAKGVMG